MRLVCSHVLMQTMIKNCLEFEGLQGE